MEVYFTGMCVYYLSERRCLVCVWGGGMCLVLASKGEVLILQFFVSSHRTCVGGSQMFHVSGSEGLFFFSSSSFLFFNMDACVLMPHSIICLQTPVKSQWKKNPDL